PLMKGGKKRTKEVAEYRNGIKPKGGAKTWETVSMVYGVVHLVDKQHWVAISIDMGEQIILREVVIKL
ncbi:hypothetical protein MKW92_036979, partial [Papaver armeniacum]